MFAAVLRSNTHAQDVPDGEAAAVLCSGRGASGCGVLVYKFATLAEAIDANSAPCPNSRCAGTHVLAWRANNKMHTRSARMRQRSRAEEFRRAYPVPVNKGHAPPPETWPAPDEFNPPLDIPRSAPLTTDDDSSDGLIPDRQIFRHRPYTPAEIQRGREAALAAHDGRKAAEAWALDRSLDPEAPTDDLPQWSDASALTVDDAQTALDWQAGQDS